MNIGVTEISPKAVQRAAEKNFKSGYYCCEALMCTIRDEFKLDVPKEVIAMSSGMAVGAGKSGCVCGAFNGGLLALGMFFGRTEQDGPANPKSVKCMELVHELHDWFKKANGKNAICCRVLTKEFNMGQGEHKEQCIFFTGLCAWKVAQIVCRELLIKFSDRKRNISFIFSKQMLCLQIRVLPVMEFYIRIFLTKFRNAVRRHHTDDSICRQKIHYFALSLFYMQDILLHLIIIFDILIRIF